jgi:hypothetical protein
MLSLDSPVESPAAAAHIDAPALTVAEELPPEPVAVPAAAHIPPSLDSSPSQPLQSSKPQNSAAESPASAAHVQTRKPQPVRRPLNRALHPPAASTQRANVPDSARTLRETAYFAAIPGENVVAPKPPVSTGPANFPNSPFGKASGGTGEVSKKGTVRVVGKNGSIVNVPQRLMA